MQNHKDCGGSGATFTFFITTFGGINFMKNKTNYLIIEDEKQ